MLDLRQGRSRDPCPLGNLRGGVAEKLPPGDQMPRQRLGILLPPALTDQRRHPSGSNSNVYWHYRT